MVENAIKNQEDIELQNATTTIIEQLNESLEILGAPLLGLHDDASNRAYDFVEFEEWLRDAPIESIIEIINDYGYVPIMIALSGIDIYYSILMQQKRPKNKDADLFESIELSGYVRYIDTSIINATGGKAFEICTLGQHILGPDFPFNKQQVMRVQFIERLISKFINQKPGIPYHEAMKELMII